MYRSKAKQKEANRKASRRYRTKQGMTEGITPPIINALLDPKKRKVLEFVSQEIQRKSLPGENLFYGVNGYDFTVIPELLRITANLV